MEDINANDDRWALPAGSLPRSGTRLHYEVAR
jgi:hypothetical protein